MRRYHRAIYACSDEDKLLPAVAKRSAPVRVDLGDGLDARRPVLCGVLLLPAYSFSLFKSHSPILRIHSKATCISGKSRH